jgi:DNA-binding CsgD family transcriptional regulator
VQGDDLAARALYEESLTIFKELEDPRGMASCLQGWARMVARQGEAVWAARLWGAAQSLREASHPRDPLPLILPDEHTDETQWVTTARTHLGEQAWALALAEGRMMTPEQALAAQGQPLLPKPPRAKPKTNAQNRPGSTYPNGLTEREVEVLRLLAQGLTDAQISQVLGISPRTVNAHLRSIYRKLGVTSRTAATHYAIQQKLV